ncbi:MAG: hypothetical protein ACYC3G_03880 [Minisyncoccota bacterium]
MKLRFGDLENIISVKKIEIQRLQEEINKLLTQECDNVEKCEIRLAGISCDACFSKSECREGSQEIFSKVDLLEEEMKKQLMKVKYLFIELFLSQHKDAQLKYLNLELFP